MVSDNKYELLSSSDLVKKRSKLKISQTEFWARVNLGLSTGNNYERGKEMPSRVKQLVWMAYFATDKQLIEFTKQIRGEL